MIALAVFVVALLLAIEALEPTGGWLVTLAVLSGIGMFNGGGLGLIRLWMPASLGRHNWRAVAITVFVISLLLAIGTIDPEPPWLVTVAVLSGILAFVPRRSGRVWLRRRHAWAGASWDDDDAW
jgi:hypothetical protein